MILMIDNYDSFTYNIVQYCLELGADLKIIRNDEMSIEEIKALNPQKIIISPGPATPDDAGICLEAIKVFGENSSSWDMFGTSSDCSSVWWRGDTSSKNDARKNFKNKSNMR